MTVGVDALLYFGAKANHPFFIPHCDVFFPFTSTPYIYLDKKMWVT